MWFTIDNKKNTNTRNATSNYFLNIVKLFLNKLKYKL